MKNKLKDTISSLFNNESTFDSDSSEKTNTFKGVSLSPKSLFNKEAKKLSQPSFANKSNVTLEVLKIDYLPDTSHLLSEDRVLDVTFDMTVPSGLDKNQVESHLVKLKLEIKKYKDFIKKRQKDFELIVQELEKANATTQEIRHEMELFSLDIAHTKNDYQYMKELLDNTKKENESLKRQLEDVQYKKKNKISNENQKSLPDIF